MSDDVVFYDAADGTWQPVELDDVTEIKLVAPGHEPIYFFWNGEPWQEIVGGDGETFIIRWTESGVIEITD